MSNIRNFCVISHIDHGKSTLADRFLELTKTVEKRKMQAQFLDRMELERERGITIKLQPVRMLYRYKNPKSQILNSEQISNFKSEISNSLGFRDSNLEFADSEQELILNLIDTPGHVDFSYEVSRSLAAVEGAILLVDATKGVQAQTLANLRLALEQKLKIIPVINKIDLPNAKIAEAEKEIRSLLANLGVILPNQQEIIKISAKTGEGVEKVLRAVVKEIPPPAVGETTAPTQALIFDSQYDSFKGVIAFVRVFAGQIKKGQRIKLLAQKISGEVSETGYFSPDLQPQDRIIAGEIGYVATGVKNPAKIRVGDTVGTEGAELLRGYRVPQPVVFASFFPQDADQFGELKSALEKLKLTDAALFFEPENSLALGRGFRLGFLGLLHAEIISERLKREFNLSLIVSAPTVEYEIKLRRKEAETLKLRSVSQLPDPGLIESIREPYSHLEIFTPAAYLGSVMELLSHYRSQYQTTDYLGVELIKLVYQMPFSEMITDFYDRLKSVSAGYASLNYQLADYYPGDLVRLDILVAGDKIDPFSRIVPREQAEAIGRSLVEKLKEILPPQLFTVALQAAVGGKIVARENIKARRKDVTGYLYGGDVTRKKKLLEKQKRGKERMKREGKVAIPQKVFLEMLRR